MSSADAHGPGFFGKVPAHGDFISRRVSEALVGNLDAWLQQCLTASRLALGERWTEVFRISPLWRFAVSPGLWADGAVCGISMPSVDRVGRYFPMVSVYEFEESVALMSLPFNSGDWFSALETTLLTCLDDDFDVDAFDQALNVLGAPTHMPKPRSVTGQASVLADCGFEAVANGREEFEHDPIAVLEAFAIGLGAPASVWWSDGSDNVTPRFAVLPGVPEPERCVRLLEDGA